MDQAKDQQNPTSSFLDALRDDDYRLLHNLYERSYPKARSYILGRQGNESDATDVYQEAFVAVWQRIRSHKFSPVDEDEFAMYLIRSYKNKWIDLQRKRKSEKIIDWDDSYDKIEEENKDDGQTDEYIKAVKLQYNLLGERCRKLLAYFYFHKKRLGEIATEFDWTEATAKNNKYRCLKQLRDMVIKGKKTNEK